MGNGSHVNLCKKKMKEASVLAIIPQRQIIDLLHYNGKK